ncbi:sulfite exporter TauE/SafE family protein [Bacillus shivajii]|uniref:sulfite exporter TauE/SafE family protein n=1 Tax=Bacillus shivajii TaxID=1983719 RepID=UPI001CFC2FAA|nr:sulfite exporter TauE/SafE family protein [Bacillus shivajii]UCZ52736.1 sulfite exporter TauE/SafE family protein [Bacillus shivajii]
MFIELLIIFLILLAGSFVQGVSGFGFGLIAMSFLPFFFTIKESTLLVVSLALVTCMSIVAQLYRHIQWKQLIVLLSAALIGRIGAFFVLHFYGEMNIMKDILGVFLIGVVIYLFRSKGPKEGRVVNRTWLPISLGLLGGFVGGVFAVGGPFFVFYLMLIFSDNKYAYSANLQVTFLFTNSMTILLHGFNGDFTTDYVIYFIVGVATVLIGSRLGVLCFNYISQENMKKLAGIVVAIAAVNLILFG